VFNTSYDSQYSTRGPYDQQTLAHRVADQYFNRIAHWASAELRMESLAHEKRQNRRIEFQSVTARGEEFDFARLKLFSDLKLVFVAQAMEYKFLVHSREDCSSTDRLRSGRLFHLG